MVPPGWPFEKHQVAPIRGIRDDRHQGGGDRCVLGSSRSALEAVIGLDAVRMYFAGSSTMSDRGLVRTRSKALSWGAPEESGGVDRGIKARETGRLGNAEVRVPAAREDAE